MGNICYNRNRTSKTRKELLDETFDGLDTNGTMSLDEHEVEYMWTVYSQHKIESLQSEIESWGSRKPRTLLSQGDPMDQKRFLQVIDELHLTDTEVFEIWKTAKQLELDKLREGLSKSLDREAVLN